MGALGRVAQIEATYTETIESALLSTAVTTHGRLVYRAPDRITKTDDSGGSVEIDGDRILLRQGTDETEIAVQDHPAVEHLVVALRSVFAGDLARLRRYYALEFKAGADRWDLALRPLDRQLLGVVEAIRIRGRGEIISRIEIEEPSGDRRSTEFRVVSRIPTPAIGP